ncbi:MAG TPA: hypothetical protein VF971_04170 [Candidatus Limnocylindrales bacterium]
MKIRLHLGRPNDAPRAIDPGRPHWFSQTFDPGISAIASGGGSGLGYGTIGSVSVTDNYIRKRRCSIPGCGRDEHDPVHRDRED